MDILEVIITAIVGPSVLVLINYLIEKHKNKNKDKKDLLSEAASFSVSFEEQLEELMHDIEADRIWVSQFHNGGHFYPTGKSIQKFSIFYEITNPNKHVIPIKMSFQNIPVSLFSHSINSVLNDGKLISTNICENDKFGLKFIADNYNTKSIYYFGLKNIDDKFLGTLGIEYTDNEKILSDDVIDKITLKSIQLGVLLNNHLKV
jgi:hypothetical protein